MDKSSRYHLIWGNGDAVAEHFIDMLFPGSITSESLNVSKIVGATSPNFSSAVPWAESYSDCAIHWYEPDKKKRKNY